MWDSWVGSNFKSKAALLLLESCYDWLNENGEIQKPEPNHPQNIVNWAIEEPLSDSSTTMRKLTRAICGCEEPSREQKFNSWQEYALTNYIPVSVGHGPIRPKKLMWEQAEQNWAAVLNRVNPRTIIVLGMELWNRMPRTTYRDELGNEGYENGNSDIAICYTTYHPSRGGSWNFYSEFILNAGKKRAEIH